jgi:phosphoribosylanthranilate isomerase
MMTPLTFATSPAALPPERMQFAEERPSGRLVRAPRTRIKICGLTREADVDAAVDAGADAVGFVQYAKSPRYIPIHRAAALARRLPPFVTPVLLFVNESAPIVIASRGRISGAILQFHGDESPQYCEQAARAAGCSYLRAARIPAGLDGAGFDLVKFAQDFQTAQGILLDTLSDGYGGSGKTFQWSLLAANVNAPLVLSGGLSAANVAGALTELRPRCPSLAVDVSSGVEADGPDGKPLKGIKDAAKIQQFIAAVRAADALA